MDPIDVAELALSLPEIDPEKPSPARIYDFWLGGSQNFATDREVGQHALARAAGAHHEGDPGEAQLQVQAIEHRLRAEALGHALEAQHQA